MRRAVFFDRDGIVNERRPDDYVTTWEQFHFLPDIFSALPAIKQIGFLAILVTNQRGVALGRMAIADVNAIHSRMQSELQKKCGATFDDIFVCPHTNEDACDCRKPKPGMLLRAASKHDIEMHASWMIGDSEGDVVAGARAGCKSIRVAHEKISSANFIVATLADAVAIITQKQSAEAV